MKIESIDQDVSTLLASAYYKIPRFQRPYSWDRENVQEFWDDIVSDNSGDYFIGSMVVYKAGKQYWGIVDGQQRLTTIMIMLCVLRDKFDELGMKDLSEGIHNLIERKNIDNKPEFVLTTESSYPFFQDYILKWGKPELEDANLKEEFYLKGAYQQLMQLINGVIKSVDSDTSVSDSKKNKEIEKRLRKIRDSILDLKLILVQLDNEDDAYLIFETLNTRGKDLRLTDLVKNLLTRLLKNLSVSVDQTKIKWTKVIETIEGSSVDISTDVFIHHFWLSRYKFLPAKKIYKAMKKEIKTPDDASKFLDNLVKDSEIYRYIHEPSYHKWKKEEKIIKDSLNALMLFQVKQQIPATLSLLRAYENNLLKKKHVQDALISIERFHFLFTAVTSQRSSGGISAMYASFARKLSDPNLGTHEAVAIIRDFKKKLKERIPSFEEFNALFPNIIYTSKFTKQRKLVKYILVNFSEAKNPPNSIDYSQMTIEHLMPQSAISNQNIDDEIVGQIGNLILVPEHLNNKLKDKGFLEKKQILLDNGFNLPDDISSLQTWGEEEIKKRTSRMAEVAYTKIWKIK